MKNNLTFLEKYSDYQVGLLEEHLDRRATEPAKTAGLGVVFDLTYWCNLNCRGCGVYAKNTKGRDIKFESTTEDILSVLTKVKDYVDSRDIESVFVNFGGGEAFLRPDILEILSYAKKLFGRESIGIDSNGLLLNDAIVQQVSPFVSYLGISIDGFKNYHDWWRKSSASFSPFDTSIAAINGILRSPENAKILEVSSVATTKNMAELPRLASFLSSIGVRNYSVHRAMPVGRLLGKKELIPSSLDFLDLLIRLLEESCRTELDLHIHHSIESIYAALIIGAETYAGRKVGEPDKRSSIGIDPKGQVFFNPWCMVSPWDVLCGGSLLEENITLEEILDEGVLNLAKEYSDKGVRCNGCIHHCSGGSRISAATNAMQELGLKNRDITVTDILTGMLAKDPACLLEVT